MDNAADGTKQSSQRQQNWAGGPEWASRNLLLPDGVVSGPGTVNDIQLGRLLER